MIHVRTRTELTTYERTKCNELIDANFESNRFDTYEKVIYYVIEANTYDNAEANIVGFVGISDNHLNQLCTHINYRNLGIASELIEHARDMLGGTIYLFINKNKETTDALLKFYIKRDFKIEYENEVEYKMYNVLLYKN
jgi:ribosomal protein S18 acetylase RimI-like enzyme